MRTIPFTKKGYEELKHNLELTLLKRPEAVKALTRGREMGDLSENGLYKAAKQELIDIDRQIRYLKNLVKYGNSTTPLNNTIIQIGHRVVVETKNEDKIFFIVGEYEADPKQNKISHKSPIGYHLMGRKLDDEIIINTPGGKNKYLVKQISII